MSTVKQGFTEEFAGMPWNTWLFSSKTFQF